MTALDSRAKDRGAALVPLAKGTVATGSHEAAMFLRTTQTQCVFKLKVNKSYSYWIDKRKCIDRSQSTQSSQLDNGLGNAKLAANQCYFASKLICFNLQLLLPGSLITLWNERESARTGGKKIINAPVVKRDPITESVERTGECTLSNFLTEKSKVEFVEGQRPNKEMY